jgi:hypothetical protein
MERIPSYNHFLIQLKKKKTHRWVMNRWCSQSIFSILKQKIILSQSKTIFKKKKNLTQCFDNEIETFEDFFKRKITLSAIQPRPIENFTIEKQFITISLFLQNICNLDIGLQL